MIFENGTCFKIIKSNFKGRKFGCSNLYDRNLIDLKSNDFIILLETIENRNQIAIDYKFLYKNKIILIDVITFLSGLLNDMIVEMKENGEFSNYEK